jgi:hypothetical protein
MQWLGLNVSWLFGISLKDQFTDESPGHQSDKIQALLPREADLLQPP